jgi:hypothetical protein
MAQKIQHKRSNTTAVPTTAQLSAGEIGYTEVGGVSKLYIGNYAGDGVVEIAGDGKMDKVSTPTNGNILTTDATGQATDSGKAFSTNGTLAGNSDNNIPTEQAVKTYADTKISKVATPTVGAIATLNATGEIDDSLVAISTDATLASDSDLKLPTEKAIRAYIAQQVASGVEFKGSHDASGSLYPTGTISKGDFWIISVGGTLGIGEAEVGDFLYALVDSPAVDADWALVNKNIQYTPENVANKINTITGTSTTFYTSEQAVKNYVDSQTTTGGVATTKNGTAVDVNVDNATIEVSGTNLLQIKDLGVSNAKLAGSITDDKLNQITTANKVAGSALQLATNGGLEDSTGLRIKNDVTTGATVAQLSITANGAGLGVDNSSIIHTAGIIEVSLVDGGTF